MACMDSPAGFIDGSTGFCGGGELLVVGCVDAPAGFVDERNAWVIKIGCGFILYSFDRAQWTMN